MEMTPPTAARVHDCHMTQTVHLFWITNAS